MPPLPSPSPSPSPTTLSNGDGAPLREAPPCSSFYPHPHPHSHSRSSRPRKPSFAASLLDSIYRSLDAEPPAVADPDLDPRKRKTTTRSDPHLALIATDVRPRPSSASSSASSDSSSFGFSSDAEHPRHRTATRRAPTRRDPPPPTPPRAKPTKPAKPSSIRSRIREFRKGRRGAPSPAPLSCFLRAIFSSAGIVRKHKPRAPPPPPPPPPPPLPPPPPPPQSRSVRFGAVSVVGEKERVPGDADLAAEARRRVEELMRVMRVMSAMRKEEEEEEEEGCSDSSSDLFELAIACDDLPVYETTHPTTINRSSAPGLLIT